MDPEYVAEEEATQHPMLLPMFVAAGDDSHYEETSASKADDSASPERDWVTQRVMDSYN